MHRNRFIQVFLSNRIRNITTLRYTGYFLNKLLGPGADGLLQEDGISFFKLEDDSGYLIKE